MAAIALKIAKREQDSIMIFSFLEKLKVLSEQFPIHPVTMHLLFHIFESSGDIRTQMLHVLQPLAVHIQPQVIVNFAFVEFLIMSYTH